eukprot:4719464-Amphidinium_carterae.1
MARQGKDDCYIRDWVEEGDIGPRLRRCASLAQSNKGPCHTKNALRRGPNETLAYIMAWKGNLLLHNLL